MKMGRVSFTAFLTGDVQADRVVPPTGFTAQLTLFAAGAMAFLAVFALALSLAAGRLAERWGDELARSATLRITAPQDQMVTQTEAALRVLETTKGVASARALSQEEQQALLAPWFGPDVPLETLPVPQLIEVIEDVLAEEHSGPGDAEIEDERGPARAVAAQMQERDARQRGAPDPGEEPAGIGSAQDREGRVGAGDLEVDRRLVDPAESGVPSRQTGHVVERGA